MISAISAPITSSKPTSSVGKAEDRIRIASSLCVQSNRLKPVALHSLNNSALRKCTVRPITEFGNAITSALIIGASSIVYGAVLSPKFGGTIIEHAWLKFRTGEQADPVFQFRCKKNPHGLADHTYYALAEIRVEQYMWLLKELNIRCKTNNENAIDFMHLRSDARYHDLFTHEPLPLLID